MLLRGLVRREVVVIQVLVNIVQQIGIQNVLLRLAHRWQTRDVLLDLGGDRGQRLFRGHFSFGALVCEFHVFKIVYIIHRHDLAIAATLAHNLFLVIHYFWRLSGRTKHHFQVVEHLVLFHASISIPGGRIYWKIETFYN